jgi:F0F1-type ATP synthase membrane subunit a
VKAPVIIGIVVLVLVSIALSFLFLRAPQPEVILPAEVIFKLGPLNVTNTLIAAWMSMIFLIVLSFLATRSMNLIPSGLQNFVEGVVEFLWDQCVEIVGESKAKVFFSVVATIFLFVITSNWFGLLPFFNAVGITEDIGHEVFHEVETHHADGEAFDEDHHFGAFLMEKTGGIAVIQPNETDFFEFEVHEGDEPLAVMDRYIVALAEQYTDFESPAVAEPAEGGNAAAENTTEGEAPAAEGEHETAPSAETVQAAFEALEAEPGAPKLLFGEGGEGEHGVPVEALGREVTGVDFPGKYLALNIPIFRSAFSDANNTIGLAIISFFFVQFWGFQALGVGYLGKFFNFSSPIMLFVGLLELISEFIKIISFGFRLLGNIFAGEVLVLMLTFLVPLFAVDIIYALELFVGFIQAVVFALLTLVFAAGAVEHHGDEEHEEHHAEAPSHDPDRGVTGVTQAPP